MKKTLFALFLISIFTCSLFAEITFNLEGQIDDFNGALGIYEFGDSLMYLDYLPRRFAPTDNDINFFDENFNYIRSFNYLDQNHEMTIPFSIDNVNYKMLVQGERGYGDFISFNSLLTYSLIAVAENDIVFSFSYLNNVCISMPQEDYDIYSSIPQRIAIFDNNGKELFWSFSGVESTSDLSSGNRESLARSKAFLLKFRNGILQDTLSLNNYNKLDYDKKFSGYSSFEEDYSWDFYHRRTLNNEYSLLGNNIEKKIIKNGYHTNDYSNIFSDNFCSKIVNIRRLHSQAPLQVIAYVENTIDNITRTKWVCYKKDLTPDSEEIEIELTEEQGANIEGIKAGIQFLSLDGPKILAFYDTCYKVLDANTYLIEEMGVLPNWMQNARKIDFDYLVTRNKQLLLVKKGDTQYVATFNISNMVGTTNNVNTAQS